MRSFIALITGLFLAACSAASPAPADGVSQSEVSSADTSQCPRELRVHAGFARVGLGIAVVDLSVSHYSLTEAERERFDDAIAQFRGMETSPITIEADHPVVGADSCTYLQDDITAVLRTLPEGPVLEINKDQLQIVAPLRRFAPEGVRVRGYFESQVFALISDPAGTGHHYVNIGGIDVVATGEQITRNADVSAIRIPLLQASLEPLPKAHPAFEETMVIDAEHAGRKYLRFLATVESTGDSLASRLDPLAFQTTDPDTTICFLGPAEGVCEILDALEGSAFADGFTFANAAAGEQCLATASQIVLTFRTAASPQPVTMVIPPCQ